MSPRRRLGQRPQVGLVLSIGEQGEQHPKKLDHFRAKPGQSNQYAAAAKRFAEVYGDKPKQVDLVLPSDRIGDVLDVRWKAYVTGGSMRAIGDTNYADAPDLIDGPETLRVFPADAPGFQPASITGPDDPLVAELGLAIYTTFRFVPYKVSGLTTLGEISTRSRQSSDFLFGSLTNLKQMTGGRMAGLKLKLVVTPARTRYWDPKEKKRKVSTFWALRLVTPYTVDEFYDEVAKLRGLEARGPAQRAILPPVDHASVDRDEEVAEALWHQSDEVLDGVVIGEDEQPGGDEPT